MGSKGMLQVATQLQLRQQQRIQGIHTRQADMRSELEEASSYWASNSWS